MLFQLYVKNYALIDELTVQFDNGFNVITGETGVGKSILIDALTMCLGVRAKKEAVRKGKNKMVSQAIFTLDKSDEKIKNYLDSLGIEDDQNIILTREVYENGKSIGRINGLVVNINNLKEIGMMLVDIHSQREHQSLLDKKNHLSILDGYIGEGHKELLDELHNILNKYLQLKKDRDGLLIQEQQLEREKDLLHFQLRELGEIQIVSGEDEELEMQLKVLNHAEMIFHHSHASYNTLYVEEQSVYNQLAQCVDAMSQVVEIDSSTQNIYGQLNDALVTIEDAAFFLRDYKDSIQYDDDELNAIHLRLNKINTLKKKYGPEIVDIHHYKEDILEKLKIIENRDDILERMNKEINMVQNNYMELAKKISKIRKKYAIEFAHGITAELKDLAMEKSEFYINISSIDQEFRVTGIDQVEFYMVTNKGEDKKPLIQIASGGELSRIILAIKSIINTTDYIDTLIFDEIDMGISGRTAQRVAQKINHIGNKKQVICITHLPQIASMADCHYNVIKETNEKETFTLFKKLKDDERCIELARMISGKEITKTSIDHAKEMLSMNGKIK
ncbi:MAG: DNA repair protein RecN [Eubacteriales bacterium]